LVGKVAENLLLLDGRLPLGWRYGFRQRIIQRLSIRDVPMDRLGRLLREQAPLLKCRDNIH
jgi:hypothetical protein